MIRAGLFLLLIAVSVGTVCGALSQGYLVRAWQSEDGLPGNVVRSLAQTPDGFLWVATAEGVVRFDGREFVPVEPPEEANERRLGVFRLVTTQDDRLWLTTFRGDLLEIEGLEARYVFESSDVSHDPAITQLVTDGEGLVAKSGDRLVRLSGDEISAIDSPGPDLLEKLADDAERQAAGGRRPESGEPPFLVSSDKERWSVGAEGRLVLSESGGPEVPLELPDLQGALAVNEFFEDREGNLWLATAGQGLIQIRRSRVRYFATDAGPLEGAIHAAVQTRDGGWWIARRAGGIDRIKDGRRTSYELVPGGYPRPVVGLFEDPRGRLWLASRDGSVFEWDGLGFAPRFADTQRPSKVKAIAGDTAGAIWFGGAQGLARLADGMVTSFENEPLLLMADVTALALTADGALVIGTADGRVVRRAGGRFEALGGLPDLGRRWVSSIMPRDNGEIWVSTLGAGIAVWKDGRWLGFDANDGLPDARITAIAEAEDGDIWVGSLGGIFSVSRSDLFRRAKDPDFFPRWLRLGRSDGMITRECIGGTQPGVIKDREGVLWFPTGSGMVGVDPEALDLQRTPPEVHLSRVRADGRRQPLDRLPVTVGPGRVRLDFSYTGIFLNAPEKVTYRARMVGLDDEFRAVGDQRQISYESVPAGRYRFEVTAINGDGFASRWPAMVPIVVKPRFWETFWFISLVTAGGLLFALTVGWLGARRRMRNRLQDLRVQNATEAERSRISRDLHDDLGASLTELSILSALAAETRDETTLRPSLNQLSAKAKVVVGTLDEIVWAANPREDTLRSLVEYLCAFAREFLESAGIALRTELDRSIPELYIGPNRRHNIVLAARESLNNAVKHSRATEIRIQIVIGPTPGLVIEILDNGRGFDPGRVRLGEGLASICNRMAACGGEADIRPGVPGGTLVVLTLPLPDLPRTSP